MDQLFQSVVEAVCNFPETAGDLIASSAQGLIDVGFAVIQITVLLWCVIVPIVLTFFSGQLTELVLGWLLRPSASTNVQGDPGWAFSWGLVTNDAVSSGAAVAIAVWTLFFLLFLVFLLKRPADRKKGLTP